MRLASLPLDMHDDSPGRRSAETKAPTAGGVGELHALLDELRPWLRRMRVHWKSGAIGFGVLCGLTLLVAWCYQPTYRSEAVVFHQAQLSNALNEGDGRLDVELMREILLRRPRLERLVGELGVRSDTANELGVGAAVGEIEKQIGFKPVSNSTFRISYRGDSAEEAHAVTQWLADELVADDRDRRRAHAQQAKEFLDAERRRAEAVLAEHEAALGRFIDEHPEFGTTARTQAEPKPAKKPANRRSAAAVAEPDSALVAERQAALDTLARASRSLAEHESKYTDQHPALAAARAAVGDAEARVAEASQAMARSDATPPKSARKPAKPRAGGNAEKRDVGATETKYMRLSRAVEEARARSEQLAADAFRADVASRSQGTGYDARVVILDPAYRPAAPIRSRLFLVKIGFAIASLLALLLVAARAIVDDRIYHAADLDPAGLSLLAVLPHTHQRG